MLLLIAACASGPDEPRAVLLDGTESTEQLRAILEDLGERRDSKAAMGRARICRRLRAAGDGDSGKWEALGRESDLLVLSGASEREARLESARRLAESFEELGSSSGMARVSYECSLGKEIRAHVLLTIASRFREYADEGKSAVSLQLSLAAARCLANAGAIQEDLRKRWKEIEDALASRASRPAANGGAGLEVSRFCQDDAVRHLAAAQRAADAGTREKASRGDLEKVVGWYFEALIHYAVASECLMEPTEGQLLTLSGMEIVARSLSDLLVRKGGE